MSSSPLMSPSHRSSSVAAPQPVPPHSVTHDTVPSGHVGSQGEYTAPMIATQPPVQSAVAREAVVAWD